MPNTANTHHPHCEARSSRDCRGGWLDPEIQRFVTALEREQQTLMRRILRYAQELDYTRYTSTLEEAWRVSIEGLTASLKETLESRGWNLEIHVEEDVRADPAVAFGVREAALHRARGVELRMFLALMKYYRQAYVDIALELDGWQDADKARNRHTIERFFDRIEIGFCTEWAGLGDEQAVAELRESNRAMTNEKNKYLTVFESLPLPAFVLGPDHLIDNMNLAAAMVFGHGTISGSTYYSDTGRRQPVPGLDEEVREFAAGEAMESTVETIIDTSEGPRHFLAGFKRMLDVSGKFAGLTVALHDVTERKLAEETLRRLSMVDELTGLYNRRGFESFGRQRMSTAQRLRHTAFFIYIDLDYMKQINDELGHAEGDRALCDLADVLRETLRVSDVCGRLGGDEFGILAFAESEFSARRMVRRIRDKIAEHNVTAERPYALSISVGLAECGDDPDCDLPKLLTKADAAMYEEKRLKRVNGCR